MGVVNSVVFSYDLITMFIIREQGFLPLYIIDFINQLAKPLKKDEGTLNILQSIILSPGCYLFYLKFQLRPASSFE